MRIRPQFTYVVRLGGNKAVKKVWTSFRWRWWLRCWWRTLCRAFLLMWTFTCPVCPLCSFIIVLYSDHREPNWNQEHYGACSLSLMWQYTLKCCLNEYNYDNTSLSNVSLAALTPPTCFCTQAPPLSVCRVLGSIYVPLYGYSYCYFIQHKVFSFAMFHLHCYAGVA